jgi:hypothetical protein
MNGIFSKQQELFDRYLELFMLNEPELFNYLHENLKNAAVQEGSTSEYDLFKSSFPDLNDTFSTEENLEIIKKSLGIGTIDEVVHILEEQGLEIDKLFPKKKKTSSIDTILDSILNLWQTKINEVSAETFKGMGFSADVIKIVREAYEHSFKFYDFNDFLKKVIKEKYQGISLDSEAEKYLAAVISQYFNEFIGQFGVNELELEVFDHVKTLQPQLGNFVEQYLSERSVPKEENLIELFDKLGEESLSARDTNALVEGYNNYLNKFKVAMLSNCGFVQYDIEQNNELDQLLRTVREYSFEIQ